MPDLIPSISASRLPAQSAPTQDPDGKSIQKNRSSTEMGYFERRQHLKNERDLTGLNSLVKGNYLLNTPEIRKALSELDAKCASHSKDFAPSMLAFKRDLRLKESALKSELAVPESELSQSRKIFESIADEVFKVHAPAHSPSDPEQALKNLLSNPTRDMTGPDQLYTMLILGKGLETKLIDEKAMMQIKTAFKNNLADMCRAWKDPDNPAKKLNLESLNNSSINLIKVLAKQALNQTFASHLNSPEGESLKNKEMEWRSSKLKEMLTSFEHFSKYSINDPTFTSGCTDIQKAFEKYIFGSGDAPKDAHTIQQKKEEFLKNPQEFVGKRSLNEFMALFNSVQWKLADVGHVVKRYEVTKSVTLDLQKKWKEAQGIASAWNAALATGSKAPELPDFRDPWFRVIKAMLSCPEGSEIGSPMEGSLGQEKIADAVNQFLPKEHLFRPFTQPDHLDLMTKLVKGFDLEPQPIS